jgi:hypothetical protein
MMPQVTQLSTGVVVVSPLLASVNHVVELEGNISFRLSVEKCRP